MCRAAAVLIFGVEASDRNTGFPANQDTLGAFLWRRQCCCGAIILLIDTRKQGKFRR
jgi:hypothetical protein